MTPRRLRVAVLTGGRSGEHEVSLQSAKSIVGALNPDKYDTVVVGIGKDGGWRSLPPGGFLDNPDDPKAIALRSGDRVLPPHGAEEWMVAPRADGSAESVAPGSIDVVFPVLHGTFGEDGTVQGLLELADVAYVGSGVLSSAVGMDKDVAKRLLRAEGLDVVDWIALREEQTAVAGVSEIVRTPGLPAFVKPANLGSSVGISKAKDEAGLAEAIRTAFQYDTKVIVERCIDAREIEVSVLGGDEPTASVPGEVVPYREFYSYEAKYIDENGAELIIPADLPPGVADEIRARAVRAFRALECEGMARVDFFLERGTGRILVNEINTIPGFTRISMYPKLWQASGLSYGALLDRLIELAIERRDRRAKLKRSFLPG